MTRKKLEKIEEQRSTFTGIFERTGTKNGYRGPEPTILLKDVKNELGEVVTSHLWFNLTKGFEKVNLKKNDLVKFDARVKSYLKGYRGFREDVFNNLQVDYKLSHPTKIRIL